jgi:hypothetical protein
MRKSRKLTAEIFQFCDEGDELHGIYNGWKEHDGQYGVQKIHTVITQDGAKAFFGSKILNDALEFVGAGTEIEIVYLGLGTAKAGKQPPKLFDVTEYYDEPTEEARA